MAALSSRDRAPDALLLSRRIITMARGRSRDAEALSIRDGNILEVGPRPEIERASGPRTRVYDFGDRPLLPGFIDVHAHLEMASLALYNRVDCHTPPCETIDDVIQAFRDNLHLVDETGWLFGQGSLFQDQKLKDGRLPDRYDLDKVSTTMPVAMRAGGHNLILNSRGLELAGITRDFRPPPGGTVERDESGEPTGLVRELEHLLSIPHPDRKTKKKAIQSIVAEHFTANGVTTVGDISNSIDGIECTDDLVQNGQINIRVRSYLWVPAIMSLKEACAWQDHLTIRSHEQQMRVQGVKLFADGGYSAALAAVKLPYLNRKGARGKLALNRRQLVRAMVKTRAAEMQLIVHSNGERAQESMCRAALELGESPTGRMRIRMEHAGNFVSDPGTRDLWREAGLLPAPQAVFLYTFGDYFPVYMGEYAKKGRFSFRTMLDEGWELPCSSDTSGSEMRHANPFFSIWCAVKRQTFLGEIIDPEQSVTVEEGIRMHTLYPAAALGEEDVKGSLEPGKLADAIVLDRDPRGFTGDELLDVKVDYVFLGGREVYRRSGAKPYRDGPSA
ncbi:MAG: amidohydrolase family protein [Chloroflexi bacterium]|nr:amidohydrolase family protein [Chloroflexota bacterium]